MEHKSFIDVVKMIAANGWGSKFESDEEAQRSLLKSVDLSSACLLGILHKIDSFIDALTRDAIKEKLQVLKAKSEIAISEFIQERESRHGPCPDIVREYFWACVHRRIGAYVSHGRLPDSVYVYSIPDKGTPERKAYDRWMKSKPRRQGKNVVKKECSK